MLTHVLTPNKPNKNKIKHSESVSWKQKTNKNPHNLYVISMGNLFFSLYAALYYATPRHNPPSDLFKNGLKLSASAFKEKS